MDHDEKCRGRCYMVDCLTHDESFYPCVGCAGCARQKAIDDGEISGSD